MHIEKVDADEGRDEANNGDEAEELGSALAILRGAICALAHIVSHVEGREHSQG